MKQENRDALLAIAYVCLLFGVMVAIFYLSGASEQPRKSGTCAIGEVNV